jgi:DNA-binding MarR family transcriptional regulator
VTDPLATSILFDVFALNQAVGRFLDDALRDGPLTPGEYAVYSAVFELEAATPTQLATRLGMHLTTFMDQLRAMERRGHATRVGHPTDRRSYRVVLTAAGLEAHRAANRRFERAAAVFRDHLPDGEAAARTALSRVRAAADAARISLVAGAETPAVRAVPSPRRPVGRAG